jgi:hypothetical protein
VADSSATLWIKIKDEATVGLNKLKSGFSSLIPSIAGVGTAVAALVVFLKTAFDAYAENEKAVIRLNSALKNQGNFTQEYSKHLQDLASSLQRTTTFTDESILETQTLLTTFGLAGEKLDQTTKAALDLATGLGVDLRTATMMLGKAWAGETGTLSRYGIKINETGTNAEKFARVMEQVNARFGGSAESAAKSYSGQIEVLKNRIGELVEMIGKEMVPVFEAWARVIGAVTTKLEQMIGAEETVRKGRQLTIHEHSKNIASLQNLKAELEDSGRTQTKLYQDTVENLEKVRQAREREIALLKAENAAKKPIATPESKHLDTFQFDQKEYEQKLSALQEYHESKAVLEAQEYARTLEAHGMHEQSKTLMTEAAVARQRTIHQAQFAMLNTGLSGMANLANAKTSAIRAAAKTAAVAMAVASALMSYASIMATPPWIAPIWVTKPLAITAMSAGLANAAIIAGLPLAKGGMVYPSSGGTHAIIGEGGRAEAVVPLDDPRTKEKLRDTLGGSGGDIHIHIEAGTIIADDYSVDMFARKIDERLFSLRRNRKSVSLD